jgi:hypothetical protein
MGHGSLCLCLMRCAGRFAICVNLDTVWTLSPTCTGTFSVFINIQHKRHFSEAFRKVTASETWCLCWKLLYVLKVSTLGRLLIEIMKCVKHRWESGHLKGRVGAVILRTGTLCCEPHRLAPWAVYRTDWLDLCCAPQRLAPFAVHRTVWHLILCTGQTSSPYSVHCTDWHHGLCTAQTGSPYLYVQGYQRRRFPSLSSAIPLNVATDFQSADPVRSRCFNIELRIVEERGWISK